MSFFLCRLWVRTLAILCLLAISGAALRAEIIISEIMYNPQGSDRDAAATPPYNREWVELYNTGPTLINLNGWQLGDAQDNNWASPFPIGTLLEPQQALVVTGDSTSFDAQWGRGINRIQVDSFPSLANTPSPTNETVAIRDGTGFIRDAVNYDDANAWPRANGGDGQSIFVRPAGLSAASNDAGTHWAPSMWGAYGAVFKSNAEGENHGSPGLVDAVPQQPFLPSPDAAWSMAVIPDSQNYAKSSADKHIFTQQTQWIRDNREAFNIQVVLHEGDIVNNNNTSNPSSGDQTSTQQWQNAQQSMFVLNGHVPYILAAGNHDYGTTNAQNRSTNINNYFEATDNPLTDPAEGGILKGVMTPGEIQNAYYEFTAPDGREMLILALEWEPRPATVAWANQIAALPEYADHTAVLLTHAYLQGNTRYSTSKVAADYAGSELWQGLVRQHENFEMTFNGHFGGDGAGYLASQADEGNIVHQMFFNTQFETHGGDGWLRIVEFLEDGTTVRVRTYSPFWDMTRDHSQHHFEFQISPLPAPPLLAGDYNKNGVVDAADYIVWRKAMATGSMAGDGNRDNVVDVRDYHYWADRFGNTWEGSGNGIATAPEPVGSVLLLSAATLLSIGFRALRAPSRR